MTYDVSVHAPGSPLIGEYEAADAFIGALQFAASVGASMVWFDPPRGIIVQLPGVIMGPIECTVRFSDPDGVEMDGPT